MRLPQDHEPLSTGDALFLHLERDGMPLNVALVAVFEGAIDLPTFTSYLESKLPLIPRYLQRVVTPPFFAGLPAWEYDRDFDIRNHIREIKLRSGTESEFKHAAADLLSRIMDRRRPLWDLTLVRGLSRQRTGLIARAHHCLADGISGVGLLKAMLEDAPREFVPPKQKAKLHLPPHRDPATALFDALVSTCFSTIERVLSMQSEFLEVARRFAGHPGSVFSPANENGTSGEEANGRSPSLDGLSRVLPELLAPAQRLPFNTICRGPQKFEWTAIPLDAIRRLKHEGATTNDVILTLIASAIQRYVRLHGVSVHRRMLRIVVPVSIRGRESAAELGNRITFVPVNVPLDVARPAKLLALVHGKTSLLKTTHIPEIVATAGGMLAAVPTGMQAMIGPIASQLPLSVCNLICTNVPGPKSPLYLLGHQLLSCYPYVPIGGEMGMNCAIITYNGETYFGFTGDAGAIPDLHLLPHLVQRSFKEFQQGSSGRLRPRRRALRVAATRPKPPVAAGENKIRPVAAADSGQASARVMRVAVGA